MTADSYLQFDNDNSMKYVYSHNHEMINGLAENTQSYTLHKMTEGMDFIVNRIYMTSILYIPCFQSSLYDEIYIYITCNMQTNEYDYRNKNPGFPRIDMKQLTE